MCAAVMRGPPRLAGDPAGTREHEDDRKHARDEESGVRLREDEKIDQGVVRMRIRHAVDVGDGESGERQHGQDQADGEPAADPDGHPVSHRERFAHAPLCADTI